MELTMELTRPATAQGARCVTILGSTGSVGRNTVDLIMRAPGRFAVEALTANRNVALLAQQARQLQARLAVVADESCYGALKQALAGSGIEAAAGASGLSEAGERPAEWVMAAIVGFAGLPPTLAAARRGAAVALANKEALVCAGAVLLDAVRGSGTRLLPVDSEHNAIFQCLDEANRSAVERLILTASGGPFRTWTLEQMEKATPAQAVAHPNWDMGAKISVDSATMMNKGLELIEAHHLFDLPAERIDIVVHPQSVIHSMVEYTDGSVLAQLGDKDMRVPIAHALAWPRRMKTPVARLDFAKLSALTFEAPDPARFPALRLAREALQVGGSQAIILNSANEIAVESYLKSQISFLDIMRIVTDVVERVGGRFGAAAPSSVDEICAVDEQARAEARRLCARRATAG
ncbi:1-deoxy-D-xylulose-5-phosphate reductoisomerase [Vineibacter terrae]|uniref:1-deoxy-D-xylulose-5-phosphate reductoisomerase n=1 Tax=Vineibacter terrae TaxID=2586908 RepID=UPI002E30DAD0|nr:1-deoxy-D-xylulose-5-phosphate reductoisomerase [Vineibacter terrae]HEX2885850.1 1-deoxy-D-xylulose-5-phosphate reductoisomerase [Vineibacter terrae]